MILFNWFLLIFFTNAYAQNCSDYYSCQLELYEELLRKSRPSIRPVQRDSQNMTVRLGFSLVRLVSVNEEESKLTIRAHINQTWNASVLGWKATEYANVQHFRVPAHSIWTPKIELLNPSTTVDSEANHFVNIRSDGLCELSYSSLLTIPCNFDLTNFPFDQQTCTFKMGSSLYDINEVSIERAFDFVIDEPGLMPNGYYFVSNTIQQQTAYFAGFDRSYDQISINFDIHRRSTYFLRLVNWPGSILMLLTLTIFFLPPSAPERIVYSSILLVCQFLLLIMFAFYVPKRLGTTWPWMGRTIFYDICLTGMTLVFSVLVRMLSDEKYFASERPSIKIRNFVFGFLSKLVGFRRLSFTTLIAGRESEYDINDSVMEPLTSVANNSAGIAADSQNVPSNILNRDVCLSTSRTMGCCGSAQKKHDKPTRPSNLVRLNNDARSDLSDAIINDLLTKTKFSKQEILDWWHGFLADCPTGLLDKKKFIEVYQYRYPNGKAKNFCNHVFRTFNPDMKTHAIDFQRFMCAIDITLNGSTDEKLEWAFAMYDVNGDQRISKHEMSSVVQSMFDLLGKDKRGGNNPRRHVDQIFSRIDVNQDNYVSKEEFLRGCKADEQIRTILAPHY
ncbi:unnamed protein product [Adineta ricciae]|uniref:EF-hand domain-containing protein n=2 Tax=Adineta ricciae TaxID=249248 RepID=A0A814BBI0_ADIRI|nr:unnamed protein product [Adineta ricciae]